MSFLNQFEFTFTTWRTSLSPRHLHGLLPIFANAMHIMHNMHIQYMHSFVWIEYKALRNSSKFFYWFLRKRDTWCYLLSIIIVIISLFPPSSPRLVADYYDDYDGDDDDDDDDDDVEYPDIHHIPTSGQFEGAAGRHPLLPSKSNWPSLIRCKLITITITVITNWPMILLHHLHPHHQLAVASYSPPSS